FFEMDLNFLGLITKEGSEGAVELRILFIELGRVKAGEVHVDLLAGIGRQDRFFFFSGPEAEAQDDIFKNHISHTCRIHVWFFFRVASRPPSSFEGHEEQSAAPYG